MRLTLAHIYQLRLLIFSLLEFLLSAVRRISEAFIISTRVILCSITYSRLVVFLFALELLRSSSHMRACCFLSLFELVCLKIASFDLIKFLFS